MYEYFSEIVTSPVSLCTETGRSLFEAYPKRIAEIGFGNGDYLVHLAETHGTETLVLGLEVSAVCALKAAKRLSSRKLLNARVVLCDARYFLDRCIPAGSLSNVFMNFPCPWPKTRHSSRRVTWGRFPDILAKALETYGEFRLVTDEEWYANEVRESLSRQPFLDFLSLDVNPPLEVTTKYASKWKSLGKSVFRLIMKKTDTAPHAAGGEVEELKSMHIKLAPSFGVNCRSKADGLVGKEGSAGNSHWSFKSLYWSTDGHALVKAITSDEGFEQTFFYRLVFTESGLLIKLEDVGAPLHTPSVRIAMESVAAHFGGNEE